VLPREDPIAGQRRDRGYCKQNIDRVAQRGVSRLRLGSVAAITKKRRVSAAPSAIVVDTLRK
jgi:hypothetical protein